MPRRPQYKTVTVEAWNQTMCAVVTRIHVLLDASEKLLNIAVDERLSAGLYTYAVEECGKLLLLKKYQPDSGVVKIKYRDEYCDHYVKFNEAVKSLPSECTNLRQGVFDPKVFDPKVFDTQTVLADLEARMAIFYTDFNDAGDGLIAVPLIDKNRLKNAIKTLKAIMNKTTIPTIS